MVSSLDEARRQRAARGVRLPPHDLDAEASLLGAMLLSRDAIAAATEACSAEDLYSPAHGQIFSAILALYGRGEPVDAVTVGDELARSGTLESVGGRGTLVKILAETPAISSAPWYGKIVAEHAQLRRLIAAAEQIAELAYELPDDVAAAVDQAEQLIFEVAERREADTVTDLGDLLSEALDRISVLFDRGDTITGVPTGFADLDEVLSGLQPQNLVIVGARPAMGKTSFALGLASHAALVAKVPVLIFSLEMSHQELTQRLLASEARVDSSRLRNGRLLESDWPKLTQAIGRLGEAPILIDDNPNLTIMDIRAKARRAKARNGLGLVVIDYLQLMTGRNSAENRQVEVAEISRGLKVLARELGVPVVALSQLSRNLEMRQDKRPMLADLRESGSLEQDADVVLFLYRDEVYHPDSADRGVAEVIVAKHRNGPTATTKLAFLSDYTRFANMARI